MSIDLQLYNNAFDGDFEATKTAFSRGANINMAIMGATTGDKSDAKIQIANWALEQGAHLIFGLSEKHVSLFYRSNAEATKVGGFTTKEDGEITLKDLQSQQTL